MNFKALIFDMDGVIIDSEPVHAEAKRLTFQHYGADVPAHLFDEFKGKTDLWMAQHVVTTYLNGTVPVEEFVAYKHQAYRGAIEQVELIPGVFDFIQAMRPRYRMALTTSATLEDWSIAFDKFDLHRWFDVIVTAEQLTHHKPHPEPYLKTLEKLSLQADECLVIEDSVNGVLSGKAAGCTVAGLLTTFSADVLREAGADRLFSSFAEIENWLTN